MSEIIRLRIVVIGPKPLVKEICKIATEFSDVETKTIIYKIAEESAQLVRNYQQHSDIFIFAGPTPYHISKENLPPNCLSYYIPFEGSDIYRVLLKLFEKYHFYPAISFDVVCDDFLKEIYEEMEISNQSYYLKSCNNENEKSDAIVEYHLNLLAERKVEVVATTLNSVYERLKDLNAPVFLIKHTKATIRDTLYKAILKGKQQKKEETQITVLQFHILNKEGIWDSRQRSESHFIKERILEYGNLLFSSTKINDDHIITLYTTQGVFEKVTRQRTDFTFLNKLNELYSLQVYLGIGIGSTAESAAYNAKNALEFAIQRKEGGCCFLIDEQKRIHGPLGTSQSMDYTLLNSRDENQTSLTLRKFYAWMSMMRKNEVTTREISIGMNTSERHAARILKDLSEKKMAKIIGKELIHQKGRPRLIYDINLLELAKHVNETEKTDYSLSPMRDQLSFKDFYEKARQW